MLKIDKQTGKLVTQRTWGGLGIDGVTTSIAQDSHGFLSLSGKATSAEDGTDTGKSSAVVMKVKK